MVTRRVMVVTVVHHPWDARIWHRQIAALLRAGWQVTYAAPFSATGLTFPEGGPALTPIDLPRAFGRRRFAALRGARKALRSLGPGHDVVLLHDPELLVAAAGLALPPVVWDVHEDTAAAVEVRGWLPDPLRRPVAAGVRRVEAWAEGRHRLLLADAQYAGRFRGVHPVVANSTAVVTEPVAAGTPDEQGRHRVVYLGSVALERGAEELVEIGRRLTERTGGAVVLDVLGPAHGPAAPLMRDAASDGVLRWHGFVPNDEALLRLDGALAGLSPLHDVANFRPSMPTKVVEYLAHGVPAITTPLPLASDLVTRSGGGLVVPFLDTSRTVEQLLAWHADPEEAARVGRSGHRLVAREHDWTVQAGGFVAAMEDAAASGLTGLSSHEEPGPSA